MSKLFISTLGVLLLGSALSLAQTPQPDEVVAIEAARREGLTRDLRELLAHAAAVQQRGEIPQAAAMYQQAVELTDRIGTNVETERRLAIDGLSQTRLELARRAQASAQLYVAQDQVDSVLKVDPNNPAALKLKKEIEQQLAAEAGRRPSADAISRVMKAQEDIIAANTLVQDAKLLYEAKRLREAEDKLTEALRLNPSNKAAFYYLDLIKNYRFHVASQLRESLSKQRILDVVEEWVKPDLGPQLPSPNITARTNLVNTSRQRQSIYSKLDRIRLNQMEFDSLPLSEVLKWLDNEAQTRDPDEIGVNFMLAPNADPAPQPPPPIDPQTGLPLPEAFIDEGTDLGGIIVKIQPPLRNLSLREALDAVITAADRPVKYSVDDFAVVFTPRPDDEIPRLYTRWFKLDPNTFLQGIQGVVPLNFGTGGGQGGGQGGQGGGGFGGGLGGGGFGAAGGLGAGAGAGGQQGLLGQQQGGGISFLTSVTPTEQLIQIVRQFFTTAGIDLEPPKNLYFNDRLGMLMVHATMQDLDIIEEALHVLNMAPPQITIESKFAEISQTDARALGFDWWLGNTLLGKGKLGFQGGSAPSQGLDPLNPGSFPASSQANPTGIFPGPNGGPAFIPPSATDGKVTTGLRNSFKNQSIPELFTLTGILTDPQFRVVIRALDQREGVDLLSAPKITTLSSRQAQIKVVDIRYIVIDLGINQTAAGGGGTGIATPAVGGGGVVGSTLQPISQPFELGPTLDVIPYVAADGYTIQMTVIPTLREFVGYDLQSASLFQAQAQSVGAAAAAPLTTTTPLPIFRLRQVVTSSIVWDGQTVVLGGLISENITKMKDKVPLIGDLPLVGRFFRSESNLTEKKNLIIFVTPTIIDPAGNRMHSDEELPFAKDAIPAQVPFVK